MKIALGVSGGIACYKAAEILRRLQDRGFDVAVVMTKGAAQFVTPLTFRALSGSKVYMRLCDPADSSHAPDQLCRRRWGASVGQRRNEAPLSYSGPWTL